MEISFSDEKLSESIENWLDELGIDLDESARTILSNAFREGWARSIQENLTPALDLCLIIMRMASIAKAKGDYKLVLNSSVIDTLLEKCKAIVGDADLEALAQAVEVVVISGDPD